MTALEGADIVNYHREVFIHASISHPTILPTSRCAKELDPPAIIFPVIEGGSLRSVLEQLLGATLSFGAVGGISNASLHLAAKEKKYQKIREWFLELIGERVKQWHSVW
jgi:hypothetical protein